MFLADMVRGMARAVVLQHDLPDGSRHFDWLIAPDDAAHPPSADERVLIAFRLRERPDDPLVVDLEAAKMPDHRWMYLEFEGELEGGGRGAVKRVGEMACRWVKRDETEMVMEVKTERGRALWYGKRRPCQTSADGLEMWEFEAVRG